MTDRREDRTTPRAARGVAWVVLLAGAIMTAAVALAQVLVWIMA